jgi:hypothetical protein
MRAADSIRKLGRPAIRRSGVSQVCLLRKPFLLQRRHHLTTATNRTNLSGCVSFHGLLRRSLLQSSSTERGAQVRFQPPLIFVIFILAGLVFRF